jgi:hypothetical protein
VPTTPPPDALRVAASALFAAGVHLGTAVALVALGGARRGRGGTWGFLALLTLWLATLVFEALGGRAAGAAARVGALAAAVLPVAFLAFALGAADDPADGFRPPGSRRWRAAVVTAAALLAPLAAGSAPGTAGRGTGSPVPAGGGRSPGCPAPGTPRSGPPAP